MAITHLNSDSKGRPQVFISGNNNEAPDYPYIEITPKTIHTTEQSSIDHSDESYRIAFAINCYSNLPEDSFNMAEDVMSRVWDPTYKHVLDEQHIAVVSCATNGDALTNFANLLDVSAQSITLTLRIRRQYKSDYFTIKDTNLGGTDSD